MQSSVHLPAAPKLSTPFHLPKVGAAPKIRAIKISPTSNGGIHVQHSMQGGKVKSFVFSNPKKMVTHLKRLEANAWLSPMQDTAPREVHLLNDGMTP